MSRELKIKIGEQFGKLTVTERVGRLPNMATKHIYYKVKCDCGNEETTRGSLLKNGKKEMCLACYRKHSKRYKHGLSGKNRIYRIWRHMKDRCLNETDKQYFRYGGRGISICEEWETEFINFYNWTIQNGYTEKLTIDRINNDGNYEPNNCRWVDMKTQSNNRRSNRMITIGNETHTLTQWSEKLNRSREYIRSHYCKEANTNH